MDAEPLVVLDAATTTPPFEQVRGQLAAQITDGRLVTGARLPTVRALARALGLAVNTVARAYRELESAGLVETQGRAGTVVSAAGDRSRARLRAAATRYAALALELGIGGDEAARMIDGQLAQLSAGAAVLPAVNTTAPAGE